MLPRDRISCLLDPGYVLFSFSFLMSNIFYVPTRQMNIRMRYGGVKMGAVHECRQWYIHVCEGLTPRHAWGWGKGGFANKQVMS